MIEIVTITNTHHFNTGIKLIIEVENNKIIKRTLYKDDENIEDPLKEMCWLFTLTGVAYSLEFDNKKFTLAEIIKLIYAMSLYENIKFVGISICGCNMGHCTSITDYKIMNDLKTFGDLFDLWGDKIKWEEVEFYEYPDSVILSLKYFHSKFRMYDKSCYGSSKDIDLTEKFDPNYKYIDYFYSR